MQQRRETDEIGISLGLSDDVSAEWLSKLRGDFTAEDICSFLRYLYGNPEYDDSEYTGEFYIPIYTKISEQTFRKLGWLDARAMLLSLKIDGKEIKLDDDVMEALASQMIQLSPDGFMYISG